MWKRGVEPLTEYDLDCILATQAAEREYQYRYERDSLHPAFGRGFHSTRWPFDISRAIVDEGYRTELAEAIGDTFYNPQWRAMAKHEYKYIVMPRLLEGRNRVRRQFNVIAQFWGMPPIPDPIEKWKEK